MEALEELELYLIYKMELENKNAYDDETQVSDAYLIYEEIYDKIKELKGEQK